MSVGRPYFDRMAVPIGLALLFLMGVGPGAALGHRRPRQVRRALLPPLPAAAARGGARLRARRAQRLDAADLRLRRLRALGHRRQGLRPARQRVKKGEAHRRRGRHLAAARAAPRRRLRRPRRRHRGVHRRRGLLRVPEQREARLAPGEELESAATRSPSSAPTTSSSRIASSSWPQVAVARGGRDLGDAGAALNHYPTQMEPIAHPGRAHRAHPRPLPDADERRPERRDRPARDRDAGGGVDLGRRVRDGRRHRALPAAAAPHRRGARAGRRERAPARAATA